MDNEVALTAHLETTESTGLPKFSPVPIKYEKTNILICDCYNTSNVAQKNLAYTLSTLKVEEFFSSAFIYQFFRVIRARRILI